MKLLSAKQIHEWDAYTIAHEPISSYDLMERAVDRLSQEIIPYLKQVKGTVFIFCGMGNNGGDGLALARKLWFLRCRLRVYVVKHSAKGSADFSTNLERLSAIGMGHEEVHELADIPEFTADDCVVDALLGSGLNKPLSALVHEVVSVLNASPGCKMAIDVPTGMFAEPREDQGLVFHANHTFSFQIPKLNFLLPDTGKYVGELHVLDIGLHCQYLNAINVDYHYASKGLIASLLQGRNAFSHKGTHGHAALLVGGQGTYGAGMLALKSCLKSGAGKVTGIVPESAVAMCHQYCPEVMLIGDGGSHLIGPVDLSGYDAIGVGPGIGQGEDTVQFMRHLLMSKPNEMVIDADAINILAAHKDLLDYLPEGSVLTPHFKEFERLVGKANSDIYRIEMAKRFASKYKVVVVLKGAHTFVTDGGVSYFNSTGNSGMATAGAGDVLTGIITSFKAQGYDTFDAAILAVYIHGLAGDLALTNESEESLLASEIIDCLGNAFKQIKRKK